MEVLVATYENGERKNRIRCIKCDVTFEHIKKFLLHIKSSHEKPNETKRKRFDCDKCEKTYAWNNSLEKHKKKEHKKNYRRKLKRISSNQNFDIEFEDVKSENIKVEGVKNEGQIEGLKPSKESDVVNAEKPTESPTERKKHSSHEEPKKTKLKKFDCDKCDKTYAHKRSLDTHKKRVHKKFKKNCRKSPKSISFPNVPRALRSHTRYEKPTAK